MAANFPISLARAFISGRLAVVDPVRAAALIDQATAVAENTSNDRRSYLLREIAERLAEANPPDPRLIDQAITVAGTIPGERERSEALAGIAARLAVIDPVWAAALIDQAITMAETIPGERERSEVLRAIAERLAAADPQNSALASRALSVIVTVPDHRERGAAWRTVAERLAVTDSPNPALIDKVIAAAEPNPSDPDSSRALARIAERLAAADPSDPVLTDRAIAAAESIPHDGYRAEALARIHSLTRSGMLEELSRWRLRSLSQSIDLITVFLGNSHDKTTAARRRLDANYWRGPAHGQTVQPSTHADACPGQP